MKRLESDLKFCPLKLSLPFRLPNPQLQPASASAPKRPLLPSITPVPAPQMPVPSMVDPKEESVTKFAPLLPSNFEAKLSAVLENRQIPDNACGVEINGLVMVQLTVSPMSTAF